MGLKEEQALFTYFYGEGNRGLRGLQKIKPRITRMPINHGGPGFLLGAF
jgi:hypothetical protein